MAKFLYLVLLSVISLAQIRVTANLQFRPFQLNLTTATEFNLRTIDSLNGSFRFFHSNGYRDPWNGISENDSDETVSNGDGLMDHRVRWYDNIVYNQDNDSPSISENDIDETVSNGEGLMNHRVRWYDNSAYNQDTDSSSSNDGSVRRFIPAKHIKLFRKKPLHIPRVKIAISRRKVERIIQRDLRTTEERIYTVKLYRLINKGSAQVAKLEATLLELREVLPEEAFPKDLHKLLQILQRLSRTYPR